MNGKLKKREKEMSRVKGNEKCFGLSVQEQQKKIFSSDNCRPSKKNKSIKYFGYWKQIFFTRYHPLHISFLTKREQTVKSHKSINLISWSNYGLTQLTKKAPKRQHKNCHFVWFLSMRSALFQHFSFCFVLENRLKIEFLVRYAI